MDTDWNAPIDAEDVAGEDALDRLAAVIEYGQGKTAAQLMALQLIGGVRRTTDRWDRGRINLFLCASPSLDAGSVFERVAGTFGSVRWYNANAVSGDDLTFATNRRARGVTPGILFADSVDAVYLDRATKIRPSTRNELSTILTNQTYPVRQNGYEVTLRPRTATLLSDEPRHESWDTSREIARQISAPDALLAACDAVLIGGHPNCGERPTAEPLDSIEAFEFVRVARKCEPGWETEAVDVSHRFIERAQSGFQQIENDHLRNLMRLQSSGLPGTVRRLSEAVAKTRLADRVEVTDVTTATAILTGVWADAGFTIAPETGFAFEHGYGLEQPTADNTDEDVNPTDGAGTDGNDESIDELLDEAIVGAEKTTNSPSAKETDSDGVESLDDEGRSG